jgi:phosphoribosylanthranilate isomerase
MPKVKVKLCGVTGAAAAEQAAELGASFVGAVFFAASPRAVSYARAAEIFEFAPARVARVGLFVDPDDDQLTAALRQVRLDYLQLHGGESPERVEQIRLEFGLPVIKAIAVQDAQDLDAAHAYDGIADLLLFDAKPAAGATRPGGHGIAFDWRLMRRHRWACPWFLAGGLTPGNVAAAIALSGAAMVDVSTGVEAAPGVKDYHLMQSFIAAAKAASS